MKAGLLTIYYLLAELASIKHNLKICVALNSHEEIGSDYAIDWIKDIAKKSKLVLVIETGRGLDSYVLQRKGGGRFEIEFNGLAAHAGSAFEKGKNAIREMAYWIEELSLLTDLDKGTTVNVGIARGGIASNIVADFARISVDFRFYEENEVRRIKEKIAYLLKNPCESGIKVTIEEPPLKYPMHPSGKTMEYFNIFKDLASKQGLSLRWESSGGGSDGNYAAGIGVPVIDSMGPVGENIHGDEELLLIDTILPRLELLFNFILKLVK
jgi:glutamate carboxypeptidase